MAFRPTYRLEGAPELIEALSKLSGAQVDKATERALRSTANMFPSYMARAMARHYSAKQSELKSKIRRPKISGGYNPTIDIESDASPMSGRLFKPLGGRRWIDRKNASIKVFKGGARIPRRRGFRQESFAKGSPFVRSGSARLPIERVMGPSFHSAFTGGKYKAEILDNVEDMARGKLESSIYRSLRSVAKGYIK